MQSVGNPDGGVEFSDQMIAGVKADKALLPYGYTKCVDDQGDLLGLSLILADSNNRNRINLNLHGRPEDIANDCPGYIFPSPNVYKAAIFADETRVYGVKFLSVIGESDIGSLKGTPTVVTFGPTTLPIGFYGTYGEVGITSLGILTHDPACTAIMPPPEPEPEKKPEKVHWKPMAKKEEEESGGGSSVIAVAVIIPLIVIGGGVGAFLWWRRRKRKGELNNVAPPIDTKYEDEYDSECPPHMGVIR